jgi:uncharacterized integral membrane protein
MPWRLVGFIILFGIFLLFITLNLGNSCDISFGFTRISAVPVYLTAFCAFAVGLFCAIPLAFSLRQKKNKPGAKTEPPAAFPGEGKPQKKRGKKGGAVPEDIPEISPYREDGGPYGID